MQNGYLRQDLLKVLFCEQDYEVIATIPICLNGGDDTIVWYYALQGVFTVSSTYKLGLQIKYSKEARNFMDSSKLEGHLRL